MKIFIAVFTGVIFCAALSIAAEDLFSKIDKSKDGKISKQEYMDAVEATFNKYDLNKNGVLTKEEIKLIEKIEADKFIKDLDSNKDGKISRKEYIDAAGLKFKLMDKNKDGYIDKEEWSKGKYPPAFILFTF